MLQPGHQRRLSIDSVTFEYSYLQSETAAHTDDLTVILLHEGLGCTAMWRDFPSRLLSQMDGAVFMYSRTGYGGSDSCDLPRPLDYMTIEATQTLPRLLEHVPGRRLLLVGHSDGASIAALYAGLVADPRLAGSVLIAPHFFTESIAVNAIQAAKVAYRQGDLRKRLKKYHGDNVDIAFCGWNDAWLDPAFRQWDIRHCLPQITTPLLLVQGDCDRYGTLAQLAVAEKDSGGPASTHILQQCDHSPHIEQPDELIALVEQFARSL